jgi:Ca-activated chloride channel family protein
MQSGGSTNGGEGIQLAYQTAVSSFIEGGTNRVVLATDGDFNVGVTSKDSLVSLVEQRAKSGVFLTVLGFGMSNLNDAMLERIADRGNGNYAFIDDDVEARRVLVDRAAGTLIAVAKDVKVQVEFNPARVSSYRLIGYENRALAAHDFNDDKKDAGEMGAGHEVTMLYELVPAPGARDGVDPLKYQEPRLSPAAASGDLFTVKVRYKHPEGETSKLIERAVHESAGHLRDGRADLKLAAAIAEFGMLLSDSPHRGSATFEQARTLAESAVGKDPGGERAELVDLITRAGQLAGTK